MTLLERLPIGGFGRGGSAAEDAPAERAAIESPVQLLFGFQRAGSAKDVEAIARDRCVSKFAKDISWYMVMPFADGYLFECHEGGGGVGYLPEVVRELSRNMASGEAYVPCGARVFRIAMRDAHPVCLLLSEQESAAAAAKAQFLRPTGRMKAAVKLGDGVVQVGLALMAFGAVALLASLAYYVVVTADRQISKPMAYEQMPHRQWDSIKRLRDDQYVNRLRYADGRWQVDYAEVAPAPPAPPKPVPAMPAPPRPAPPGPEAVRTPQPPVPTTPVPPHPALPGPVQAAPPTPLSPEAAAGGPK